MDQEAIQQPQTTVEETPPTSNQEEVPEEMPKQKKGWRFWLFIALLIIIIGGLGLYFLNL